jgi:hypothetical protein
MIANPKRPKRRWFRFSLRTLFLLVTIVGVGVSWVVHQLNWIRERHEFLNRHPQFYGEPDRKCPWPLKLFGERTYEVLTVPSSAEQAAKRLFPESQIKIFDPLLSFSFPLA